MNWILVNLALVAIWLCAGLYILISEAMTGQSMFGNVIISPGWLCLVLAGYNLVRVVISWRYAQAERAANAEEQREPFSQRTPEVVNPELRFTDPKGEDRG